MILRHNHPVNLLDLSYEQLAELLAGWGEPSFRARQVWGWLWRRLADDFEAMSDLPGSLRQRLAEVSRGWTAVPGALQLDADEGTEKALLSFPDGEAVEAVLMREGARRTVCVSTQVGCPVGCAFCATGQGECSRSLSAGEIAAQVLHFARRLAAKEERVTHVVVMGMGEPLLNYAATLRAIRNLNHPQGFALGARRFTVSTVGVVPGMRKLAKEGLELNLAVSLHAPKDELRAELVPAVRRWPIRDVLAAADDYASSTGRRVSYEYVMLAGINDAPVQAHALSGLLRGRLAHVNLIPYNRIAGLPFERPPDERVENFRIILVQRGVDATIRRSRGTRIAAGCGQLRARSAG